MRRPHKNPLVYITLTIDPKEYEHYGKPWTFEHARSIPKLGLIGFIAMLFDINEIRAKSKHSSFSAPLSPLTDAQLARAIVDQFPGKSGQQFLPASENKHHREYATVNGYRNRYNAGRLRLPFPQSPSFRYNEHGKKVNGRSGTRLLTPIEIATTIHAFNIRKNADHARRIHGDRSRESGRDSNSQLQDADVCPCCGSRLLTQRQD